MLIKWCQPKLTFLAMQSESLECRARTALSMLTLRV